MSMLFAKQYLTFKSQEEADRGLAILLQHAIENSNYLSANAFDKIVYDRETNYDPRIGWTRSMLEGARILAEPGFYYLELPSCYKFENLTVARST